MTRTLALAMLAFSLAAVAASQLILKARVAPLIEVMQPGQPWTALVLRALMDPYMWLGGGLVLVGGAAWYLALTKLPLSLMMPVASIIAPATALGAYIFLGESLSAAKIAAIVVIASGVAWLGWLNA